MSRQKVKIDQLVVPAGTPDGYVPTTAGGELQYQPSQSGTGGGGITVTAWTDLPLQSGWVANTGFGYRPQYRKVGDEVQLRGVVAKSGGGNFPIALSLIAILPAGFQPPTGPGVSGHLVQYFYATLSGGSAGRWQVEPPGQADAASGGLLIDPTGHSTAYASLDGVRFSTV